MKAFLSLVIFFSIGAYAQVNVTTHYHNTSFDLWSIGEGTVEVAYSHTIHNAKGQEEGKFVQYYDTFRKIKDIEFEVFDGEGESVNKYKKKDALDVSYSKSYQTDDLRLLIIDPEYSTYPYTVVARYIISLNGYVGLGEWSPLSNYNQIIKEATLEVSYGTDNPILTYSLNGMPEPEPNCGLDRCSFSITLENIPEINYNRYQKPLSMQAPRLLLKSTEFQLDGLVGNSKTWETFGDWYLDLNTVDTEISLQTQIEVTKIVYELEDKAAIIDSIYQYMQNKTRYVSIQLGVGGMKSLPVDFVDSKGYGDCKALTTYTQHLLKKAFIPSYQVLVQAGKHKKEIVEEFPTSQFNHVFLAVPMERDTIWLECTSQYNPSNYLGTFTDGRKVLWLDKGQSKLISTPKYAAEENLILQDIVLDLNADGSSNCEIYSIKKGVNFDDVSAYQYLDDAVINKRNYEKYDFSDFTITDSQYRINKKEKKLEETYKLDIPRFAKSYGGRLIVDLKEFSNTNSISSDSSEHYLNLKRGESLDQQIVISIPTGYRIKYIADNMSMDNDFGKYTYKVKQSDEEITISKYYQLNEGVYEGEQFQLFKDFVNKVSENERSKILFVKKT